MVVSLVHRGRGVFVDKQEVKDVNDLGLHVNVGKKVANDPENYQNGVH